MRKTLCDVLEEMKKLGIIRKCNSRYASLVALAKKKNGYNCACIVYRLSNKHTVFDPLPMIPLADVFQFIESNRYLSKIDLSKGC
ncbi:KRAB-A domain-containing protein [Plakobranchus ocellatus]|uniref:KRAB-A domain-containing protein n=1 Tax=Plakobranchus ocellatus TaxID=259542 RepID=A0AAV3YZI6_9GAST|nr:KRAB-A domain-containing protein [Plakobranchus ocellatus]